jgi:hypothetical protein
VLHATGKSVFECIGFSSVAYLMAYVDGNDNGLLDCRNPGGRGDMQKL